MKYLIMIGILLGLTIPKSVQARTEEERKERLEHCLKDRCQKRADDPKEYPDFDLNKCKKLCHKRFGKK